MVHVHGKGLLLRNSALIVCLFVCLLFVDSKIFEKFKKDRLVNHIKKCGLFSKFQYCFKFSRSTADLLPYVSNGYDATQPMALDISMTFGRV